MADFDPVAVAYFDLFNVDCGVAMENNIASQGREPTPAEGKAINRLRGANLWHFRGVQRTDKTTNFDAMSREELQDKRDTERRERVARLAALCTPRKLDELEVSETSILDLIEPPEWIGPPEGGILSDTLD